ncbi:hypothetical protein [Aliishimia ponticola]|nr:hypothetical protein [Aliishimia ponticola]
MKTLEELRAVCQRSAGTLVQDIAGVAALGVMLFGALHVASFM